MVYSVMITEVMTLLTGIAVKGFVAQYLCVRRWSFGFLLASFDNIVILAPTYANDCTCKMTASGHKHRPFTLLPYLQGVKFRQVGYLINLWGEQSFVHSDLGGRGRVKPGEWRFRNGIRVGCWGRISGDYFRLSDEGSHSIRTVRLVILGGGGTRERVIELYARYERPTRIVE